MSETIQELYLNYVNSVSGSLEEDRYFRYLFEIVQAGNNVLSQNRQILHKIVDESWLTIIEDTLDAINTIIEKPRRFVTRTEEVVPVSLARKITADSVRHLSMNTQFIAANEKGEIQPTRVLNVSTEESFDLYENRFIYHLIQKLVVFIDKRTDVIFWSTGDEIRNTMSLESKIDDAYEEIEYKIEMKVKNRQSLAENDADNMGTFMRIDRVRRLTMALRDSSFCEIMSGCAKVTSPIQRTNLMMKDPNYRKCYNLWQFLERYDSVGYTIEEHNTAIQFDEEYMLQMYVNLIANYAVFKSLSEEEPRNLSEALLTSHQVLEPKFVKEIHEEIVEDYNIPEVEIRKVIIEEVTQAQLDAEAKAAEEIALREAAEMRAQEAEEAAEEAMRQSQMSMQMMMDAQDQAIAAESLRVSAEEVAEEAEKRRAAAEADAEAARKAAAEAEQAREQAEVARAEAEALRVQMQELLAQAQSAKAEAEAAEAAAEQRSREDRAAMERAVLEASEANQSRDAAIRERDAAQSACELAIRRSETSEQAMQDAISQREQAQSEKEVAEKRCQEAQAREDRALAEQNDLETRFRILKGKQEATEAELSESNEKTKRAVAARREAERLRAAAQKKSEEATRAMEEAREAAGRAEQINASIRQEADTRSVQLLQESENRIQKLRQEYEEQIRQLRQESESRAETFRREASERERDLERQLFRALKKANSAQKRGVWRMGRSKPETEEKEEE